MTPDPFSRLPDDHDKQSLLEILDDATHYNISARHSLSETLLAHFDFLFRVFQARATLVLLQLDSRSLF